MLKKSKINFGEIIYWFAYFIILLSAISCGTRKRVMERSSQKISAITQNDIAVIKTNDIKADIHIIRTNEKVTFKAMDHTKPFYVDGKKYQNVVVEKSFAKEVDSSKTLDKSIEKSTDNTVTKVDTAEQSKMVNVERDNSFGFWDWFWLLLAIACVMVLLFRWKHIYAYMLHVFKKVVL